MTVYKTQNGYEITGRVRGILITIETSERLIGMKFWALLAIEGANK